MTYAHINLSLALGSLFLRFSRLPGGSLLQLGDLFLRVLRPSCPHRLPHVRKIEWLERGIISAETSARRIFWAGCRRRPQEYVVELKYQFSILQISTQFKLRLSDNRRYFFSNIDNRIFSNIAQPYFKLNCYFRLNCFNFTARLQNLTHFTL